MPQAIMDLSKEEMNVLNMPLKFFYGPNGEPPIIMIPDTNKSTLNKEKDEKEKA
jgi:hypothetical protein